MIARSDVAKPSFRKSRVTEPERDQRRHEEKPAADAEHPGEHARDEPKCNGECVGHLTNSQTATARMKAAKDNSIVRVCKRCCNAVAPATDTAAGRPTRAA